MRTLFDTIEKGDPVMTEREQSQREAAMKLLEDYRMGKVSSSYGSMIVQWGKAHLLEARPDIEPFLQSSDAHVRGTAIYVLSGRFRLQDYWPTAVHLLLFDPDYLARVQAATALAWLKNNTRDPRTLGVLASVVRDRSENEMIRRDAYRAMRMVASGNSEPLGDNFQLERDVDWDFVTASVDPTLQAEWRVEAQAWLRRYWSGTLAEQDYHTMLLKFGRTQLQEAREVVTAFLHSSTTLLRTTALRVLALSLRVPDAWQMVVNVLRYDQDVAYRQAAAEILGVLMYHTRDKATLRILEHYTEDDEVWMDVFDALGKILGSDEEAL